jgi:transcriptional regulator with XRE-family HTH domain
MHLSDIRHTFRMIRLYNRFNLKEMSKKLGISMAHLSQIESGQKKITIDLFERYENLTGLPADDLINLHGDLVKLFHQVNLRIMED